MYSNASFQKSLRCFSVKIVPSSLFAGMFLNDSHTHADLAASANSPSFTTDCGSSDFMNPNTAPTSHGQFAELREATKSPPHARADSNALTFGSELNFEYI